MAGWFNTLDFQRRVRALAGRTRSQAVIADCEVALGTVPPRLADTRDAACQRLARELAIDAEVHLERATAARAIAAVRIRERAGLDLTDSDSESAADLCGGGDAIVRLLVRVPAAEIDRFLADRAVRS